MRGAGRRLGVWLLLVPALLLGCRRDQPRKLQPAPGPARFGTERHRRLKGAPRVRTRAKENGKSVELPCSVCHDSRQPNTNNRASNQLDLFHQKLTFRHGSLSCLSCHARGDYDRLSLADGTRVRFTDVVRLCAQCHGPQYRDYSRGSHGGMTGYWDLSRGPRKRNICVDCHDPHTPAYPRVHPAPGPGDRFLGAPKSTGGKHE